MTTEQVTPTVETVMEKTPHPLTIDLIEDKRAFMPDVELPNEVYTWTGSGDQAVYKDGHFVDAMIVSPWHDKPDFPIELTQAQKVKAWILRFQALNTFRIRLDDGNETFEGPLANEFYAMTAAEGLRTRLLGKTEEAKKFSDLSIFLRGVLTDLGGELREQADEQDWCKEYDENIDEFCERQYAKLRQSGAAIGWGHISEFADAAHREEEVEVNATVVITTRKTVSVTVTRRHGDDDISSEVEEAVESELDGSGSYYGYDRYDSEWEMEDYEVQ